METVQCYCSQCKKADTRQEMGNENYDRFTKLFEMWERLKWLYKGDSFGCGVKYVYSNDNGAIYTHVWNSVKSEITEEIHITGDYLPRDVFNSLVKDKANTKMSKLNELRKEYLGLQAVYNDAKYYHTTYDTMEVITDTGDTTLVCANCGNDEIFWISPHTHLDHLGFTADDLSEELPWAPDSNSNGLYSDDDYDYSQDATLNRETKREYADHRIYNQTVETHKIEQEFYAIAGSMTIGQVCKKLGHHKSSLIADQISEYYSVKMSR